MASALLVVQERNGLAVRSIGLRSDINGKRGEITAGLKQDVQVHANTSGNRG
jgi:hypothetical protein